MIEEAIARIQDKIDAFLKKHRKFDHIVVEIYSYRDGAGSDVDFYFKDNQTEPYSCSEFVGRTGKYMREFVDSLYD